MHYISKHFTADSYEQLILEKEDWSEEVWLALCRIFGFAEANRIVLSDYNLEAWGKWKE